MYAHFGRCKDTVLIRLYNVFTNSMRINRHEHAHERHRNPKKTTPENQLRNNFNESASVSFRCGRSTM